MKKILIHEYKESVKNEIKLSHTYEADSVKVGNDLIYYPVNENTIRLADTSDDAIYPITYNHICNDFTKIISNIPKENSIYKTFSKNNILKSNNKYNVVLEIDEKDFSKTIYSKLDPLYSTVEKVRKDTGEMLNEIDDVTILNFIYQNSLIALELTKNEDDYGYSDEENKITTTVKEYVRYKSDLDLVNSVYLTMTQKYGTVKKNISSLDISYEYKLPAIKDMLDYFKEKVKNYEDELVSQNSSGGIASFRKANQTEYPISANRNSF